MTRKSFLTSFALAISGRAFAQRRGGRPGRAAETLPQPASESEKRILTVLDDMRRMGEVYLEVPASDGRMLRLLAESSGAKNVVEIGTSTGVSGLWLLMALQRTGGHLTTFEMDHGRATLARGHFERAGVAQLATIVEGDAHENVKRLKDPIDLAFIDADKQGYLDYLNKLQPLVRPGGLILAHNIDMAPDYVKAVTTTPALDTVFYREGAGLGITLKKR
jgi:caffeoyl-CoA O-methyltransferase